VSVTINLWELQDMLLNFTESSQKTGFRGSLTRVSTMPKCPGLPRSPGF